MHRRTFLNSALVATILPARAFADASETHAMPAGPMENVPLWPGTPPGGAGLALPPARSEPRTPSTLAPDRSIDQVGIPLLDVLRPAHPDGSALVIAPGGSYRHEVYDLEGTDVARYFNARGVTCFVLRYRLPGEGWANRSDVPLQDAQRAIRLIRANAARYGVDPARIGFLGFSAGGHLACSIATRFDAQIYAPLDTADTFSARPDFCAPLYPVVTMGPGAHTGSRNNLLGPDPSTDRIDAYSCERHITAATPLTFIGLCADDPVVQPLPNGIAYFTALRAAGIASELHVFEKGGHGFGIANAAGTPAQTWPHLLTRWAAGHGFFTQA